MPSKVYTITHEATLNALSLGLMIAGEEVQGAPALTLRIVDAMALSMVKQIARAASQRGEPENE